MSFTTGRHAVKSAEATTGSRRQTNDATKHMQKIQRVRGCEMEKLKLCPFCGGLAHIKREIHTIAMWDGHEIVNCYVECWDCGARGSKIQYKKQIGECWPPKKLEAEAEGKEVEWKWKY